jgi:putative transposase
VVNSEERMKRYRRYVYEAGALDRSGKPAVGVIDNSILEKERKNDFELKRMQRFRYRTRYFTDSGIIGTKKFVSGNYRRFKDLFMSRKDKIPKPVAGLDGIYSLKRLAEG